MIWYVIQWYAAVQLMSLAALPFSLYLFRNLADRGYAFAKLVGIFGTGLILWLGTSYGLLLNERGGAVLALIGFSILSYWAGKDVINRLRRRVLASHLTYMFIVELLFATVYGGWLLARSFDPAANHTEQPMDLMFMNSIAASATFPPVDAWLAGYSISYYYFGYWLLSTIAHLAAVPISFAYNIGQASWYGLLFIGAFGLAVSLLQCTLSAGERQGQESTRLAGIRFVSLAGGLGSALAVAVSGNLQFVLEWLYANGRLGSEVAAWFSVPNFPDAAAVTNKWYIDEGWWWWRTSRVFQDLDLFEQHIEVISEFPAFSYVLGDNHPHVLAMPFAIMFLGLCLSGLIEVVRTPPDDMPVGATSRAEDAKLADRTGAQGTATGQRADIHHQPVGSVWQAWLIAPLWPLRTWFAIASVIGGLLFLNTWDFLPYWLIFAGVLFVAYQLRSNAIVSDLHRQWLVKSPLLNTVVMAVTVLVAGIVLFFPYFLTAQSQAQGFLPNLFYPTKLRHLILMFGGFLPIIGGYLIWMWDRHRPPVRRWAVVGAITFGLPIAFLAVSMMIALTTPGGQALLQRVPIADPAVGYFRISLLRWARYPYSVLLIGTLLSAAITLLLHVVQANKVFIAPDEVTGRLQTFSGRPDRKKNSLHVGQIFVLLILTLGLGLVYVPEFIYLRDNFGTRMNTVFKFYYQAWLQFGIFSGCAVVYVLRSVWSRWKGIASHEQRRAIAASLASSGVTAGAALLIICLPFPVAGMYAKTSGFRTATLSLDATSYIQQDSPDEWAAIAWIRKNTPSDAVVLEGKGASYWATYNRVSTATGRPTLLGWDGHESQWRGAAYGEMAAGRAEAIEMIYRSGTQEQISELLDFWDIDFVYLGPTEREQYQVTPRREEELAFILDTVFEGGRVKIFRGRR